MKDKYLKIQAGCLCAGILAGMPVLHAAEGDEVIQLDTLDVWGTTITSSSVYMGEDTMAIKQADHISDLLRSIPGVDVGGAHSLNQRITIRSMDDKDLRITIDGANQNTYMYHHMGNLQIHADILQSVDMDIGSNSVITGGLGGAVRFETKDAEQLLRPGEDFGGRVQASYATNASSGYSVTGYGKITEELDFLAYYNAVSRDNFEVGGGQILDENNQVIPGTDGEVRGLKGDLDDALLKFGWNLTANQRLELSYESYVDEGDYSYRPDMGLATDLSIANFFGLPLTYPTEFTRDTLTLNHEMDWGANSTLKTTVFNNVSNLTRDETALGTGVIEGEATNSGVNMLGSSRLGGELKQTLTYGLESIKYETDYQDPTDHSAEQATSQALYIQDRIEFDNGIALIPGLRYNNYDIESNVVDDTFTDTTAAFALEYQASRNLLLKASSTQLFKGPEIGEVFIGAGLDDRPNPNIEAETGLNSELAVAYSNRVSATEQFNTGVTFFKTSIDGYIYDYAMVPGSAPADRLSWKANVGDMNIEGLEAYWGYDIGRLKTLVTLSIAESDLKAYADYASLDGARLDRQQGDTVTVSTDYKLADSNINLHWDVMLVDDVDAGVDLDGAGLDNSKDGFTVHNIAMSWVPASIKDLTLTFGVDNLFDEFYASQSSRTGTTAHPLFGNLYLLDYEPGRNIKMTASYQF